MDYYGEKYYGRKINGEDVSDYLRWLDQAPKFNEDDQYFDFRPSTLNESYSMSPDYFDKLNEYPSITITPSYIDDLDFFHPFVEDVVTDKRSSIYLVGYQDPRSVGGSLKDNDRVKLGENNINVNAKISKFSSFSGHLDGQGVLDYLTDMKINKSVFLMKS